jgi:hypothetical protein
MDSIIEKTARNDFRGVPYMLVTERSYDEEEDGASAGT